MIIQCSANLPGIGLWLYALTIAMKCFFTVFERFFSLASMVKDGGWLMSFIKSDIYKAFAWFVDLFIRVKLPRIDDK